MDKYTVYLEQAAERDLKRLHSKEFDRISFHIKALTENPRPAGCRKITGSKNDWRIRVGEYRIIYEVNDNDKTVMVMRIRHRREAYR